MLKVCKQPSFGKTTKIKNHCSPSLVQSSFFPAFGTNSHTLFNLTLPTGLQNSCSPPPIIPHPKPRSFLSPLIHPKPTSFKFPAFLPESPCNVHLVYPVYPTPSFSLPQISSCLCSTLFSFALPPLLSSATLVICSVCSPSNEPQQHIQKKIRNAKHSMIFAKSRKQILP